MPKTKNSACSLPKSGFIAFYKKMVRDCKRDLKTIAKTDPAYEIVEGNMRNSETWVKFLSDPNVPELNDPKFKSKMKKLKAPKKAKAC